MKSKLLELTEAKLCDSEMKNVKGGYKMRMKIINEDGGRVKLRQKIR